MLQVTRVVPSYLTIKGNMEEFCIAIQMKIFSDDAVERSRNKDGIYGMQNTQNRLKYALFYYLTFHFSIQITKCAHIICIILYFHGCIYCTANAN